ncbi:MAG TPA: ABC transporter permease subunit, partial [Jiangellaceae bacterium]
MLTVQDLRGNRKQRNRERLMRIVFRLAAVASIAISLLILYVLVDGAINFMRLIDWDFGVFTDTGWFPRRERFDLRTIVVGSVIMGSVAMLVAVPFGLATAIYLSEYAPRRVRKIVKPTIEVLAGIPSVVVGFFVLNWVAPELVNQFFDQPPGAKSMLAAGLGIGILVIPIMASVSEDALSSVPNSLREASYGCGARKVNTVFSVVLPAAVSGL